MNTARPRRTSPQLEKAKVPTPATDTLDLTGTRTRAKKVATSKPNHTASHSQPTQVKPLEIDTLDLTTQQLDSTNPTSSEFDTLDLTGLSSPVIPLHHSPPPTAPMSSHRSPRNPTSLSVKSLRKPSPSAAWKKKEAKKRQIILRNSLAGAWDYVDAESPTKAAGNVLKGKERRRWRESEVELLDLS